MKKKEKIGKQNEKWVQWGKILYKEVTLRSVRDLLLFQEVGRKFRAEMERQKYETTRRHFDDN
jgi:hypothetical protein